jgi:sec-independent protein translocase protein TatB
MLDVGWSELLVIAIVLIVVVGPKDLPPMIRAFGKMTSRLRSMAGEFRSQFDEALKEAELDDVRKTITDAQKLNPANALRDVMNPLRQMGQDIRADLQKATSISKPADVQPLMTETPAITSSEPLAAETTPVASEPVASDPHTALVLAPSVAVTKTRAPRKPKISLPETGETRAAVSAPDVAAVAVATPKARAPRKAKTTESQAAVSVSAPVVVPAASAAPKPRKPKAVPVEGKQPAARKKRLLDETKKDEA